MLRLLSGLPNLAVNFEVQLICYYLLTYLYYLNNSFIGTLRRVESFRFHIWHWCGQTPVSWNNKEHGKLYVSNRNHMFLKENIIINKKNCFRKLNCNFGTVRLCISHLLAWASSITTFPSKAKNDFHHAKNVKKEPPGQKWARTKTSCHCHT